jgi:hypothetical protein
MVDRLTPRLAASASTDTTPDDRTKRMISP